MESAKNMYPDPIRSKSLIAAKIMLDAAGIECSISADRIIFFGDPRFVITSKSFRVWDATMVASGAQTLDQCLSVMVKTKHRACGGSIKASKIVGLIESYIGNKKR